MRDGLVVFRIANEEWFASVERWLDDLGGEIPHDGSLMVVGQRKAASFEGSKLQWKKSQQRWLIEADAREKDAQAAASSVWSGCLRTEQTSGRSIQTSEQD